MLKFDYNETFLVETKFKKYFIIIFNIMYFKIIAAIDKAYGIGFKNTLPWSLPNELKHFQQITKNVIYKGNRNAIIMGNNTWLSMNSKPLKDRLNIVIGKNHTVSLDAALNYLDSQSEIESVFVIGGQQLYTEAIKDKRCAGLLITHINKKYQCDTFFPEIDGNEYSIETAGNFQEENEVSYEYVEYIRKQVADRHPEGQYLDLVRKILREGIKKNDRTGVGTLSINCPQMRFNLRDSVIPVLTTKRIFIRGAIEEILWMLRGSTNANELKEKDIHIWDDNTSREFLDKVGLQRLEEGDIGAGYGFLMRHFGADYIDCKTDYTDKGIDQVRECLRLIREEPTSRRIIMSLWNPAQIGQGKVVLPACHCFYQWFVNAGQLSCSLYQRSGDVMLGIPFNLCTATVMTHIFARLTGLGVGELIHTIGDAHVYLNHVEGANMQITRLPRPFPKLRIKDRQQNAVEDFVYDDFIIGGYYPHETIKMKMAV